MRIYLLYFSEADDECTSGPLHDKEEEGERKSVMLMLPRRQEGRG
jgi:hypothetical protein